MGPAIYTYGCTYRATSMYIAITIVRCIAIYIAIHSSLYIEPSIATQAVVHGALGFPVCPLVVVPQVPVRPLLDVANITLHAPVSYRRRTSTCARCQLLPPCHHLPRVAGEETRPWAARSGHCACTRTWSSSPSPPGHSHTPGHHHQSGQQQ